MALLRVLARLVEAIWMLVLALFGLGVALYCLDGLFRLGSVRPDRVLGLPSVRDHVGRFLERLAEPGPAAGLALLCCLGAMVVGALLLIGLLRSSRQRLVVLERDKDSGTLAARAGPLRAMSKALAEQAPGTTAIKRPKLSLSRSGDRGRLTVTASRARTGDSAEVKRAIQERLEPISEPFALKPRIRVRVGESGDRVQ
jgi:hypothetical protein